MFNKCKINSLAVINQVGHFCKNTMVSYTDQVCLAKFLAGYMLNKELSSVSHKIIIKPAIQYRMKEN